MISLFVDTSYKSLYIALFDDNHLIDEIQIMSEFNFSEIMLPTLDNILNKNNIDICQIGKIYAVVGPGSFTGIRIGLTACKTIAYANNIPIIPISGLEFMATTKVETKYIIPFIDARHNMVFGAVYDSDGNIIIEAQYCSIDSLIGNQINDYTFVSFDNNVVENSVIPSYNATKIIEKHINDKGVNCHAVVPNYLKKTEAEEKLND